MKNLFKNCLFSFSIVFLFMIIKSETDVDDDTKQFVFQGTCNNHHQNYCNEMVENSVCNTFKNECFCRRGYVAIQEGKKTVCKTLLTDLTCRMDRDCVHVSGSMCHPGAGQCVCPAQHIYVESLNTCRRKYDGSPNSFCQLCRENDGQCFEYKPQDRKRSNIKPEGNIGCDCGNQKTSSESGNKLCNLRLVDIGGFCNNREFMCRSKKAVCSKVSNQETISICKCLTGFVAVYQKTLRYFECFPIVSESASSRCSKCFQSRGYCYDLNGDQEGDGCLCESRFSNEVDGPASLIKPCTTDHVNVLCNGRHMSVCYVPHNRSPYRSLEMQLKSGQALAIVKSATSQSRTISSSSLERRLKMSTGSYTDQFSINNNHNNNNNLNNHNINENNRLVMSTTSSGEFQNKFCSNIDLQNDRIIQANPMKNNNYRYSALLYIKVDSSKSNPGQDLLFPISCIAKNLKPEPSNEKVIEETIELNPSDNALNLDLRMLNQYTNEEVSSLIPGNGVRLDVLLVDSKGTYRELEILKCLRTNQHAVDFISFTNDIGEVIFSKCSDHPLQIKWLQASPGIHYQTTDFTINPSNISSTEYIHCLILLCKHSSLCSNYDYCQKMKLADMQQNDHSPFSLVFRTLKVVFQSENRLDISPFQDVGTRKCAYSLCLTRLQAIMTTVLMSLLLFLVIILVLILYRRQQSIRKITLKKKKAIMEQSNSNQISSLCNTQYCHKLFLLSDTGSLTTSLDKTDGDQIYLQTPRFIQNNTNRFAFSNYNENFSHSLYQQIPMYDTFPKNHNGISRNSQQLFTNPVENPMVSSHHDGSANVSFLQEKKKEQMNNDISEEILKNTFHESIFKDKTVPNDYFIIGDVDNLVSLTSCSNLPSSSKNNVFV